MVTPSFVQLSRRASMSVLLLLACSLSSCATEQTKRYSQDEARSMLKRLETVSLERRAPKGTEETIRLDRPSLLLGRGHGCDVKLRTPTASREHAKIFFRNGQWMIAGVEGKSFYADGARQTRGEVALTGGMKLRLGDDEFEVVDTAGGAASRSGGGLWARISAFVRGLFGRRT